MKSNLSWCLVAALFLNWNVPAHAEDEDIFEEVEKFADSGKASIEPTDLDRELKELEAEDAQIPVKDPEAQAASKFTEKGVKRETVSKPIVKKQQKVAAVKKGKSKNQVLAHKAKKNQVVSHKAKKNQILAQKAKKSTPKRELAAKAKSAKDKKVAKTRRAHDKRSL